MTCKSLLLISSASVAGCLFATPTVTDVAFTQDKSRTVTITYTLDEPAVVTADIQTNRGDGVFVSIGSKNLHGVKGPVNKLVDAVGVPQTLTWQPNLEWNQGKRIKGDDVRAVVTAWATNAPPDYMVFNLDDFDEVRYYVDEDAFPTPIGSDIYRREYLVMRKIHAADVPWRMGTPQGRYSKMPAEGVVKPHVVSLTQDYYIGIYPLTPGQSYRLTGSTDYADTVNKNAFSAVGAIAYNTIRGSVSDNINWPQTKHAVRANSRIDKARGKLGVEVDLPTRAQWEYACHAGTETPLYNGQDAGLSATNLAWCTDNGGAASKSVGLLAPNAFGIYDMLGSRQEWVLDYAVDWTTSPEGTEAFKVEVDPVGPTSEPSGSAKRCGLGGSYNVSASSCNAYQCAYEPAGSNWANLGYRLCAPTIAPHKTK